MPLSECAHGDATINLPLSQGVFMRAAMHLSQTTEGCAAVRECDTCSCTRRRASQSVRRTFTAE